MHARNHKITLSRVPGTQLGDRDYPLQVIEKWAILLHKFTSSSTDELPSLSFKRNVFYAPIKENRVFFKKLMSRVKN